jgi:hypothetical protein
MKALSVLFLLACFSVYAIELKVLKIDDRIFTSGEFLKGEVWGHTVGNGFGMNKVQVEKSFECVSIDQEFQIYFYRSLINSSLYSIVRAKNLEVHLSEFLTLEALEFIPGKIAKSLYSGVNAEREDYFHLRVRSDLTGTYKLRTQFHDLEFEVECKEEKQEANHQESLSQE